MMNNTALKATLNQKAAEAAQKNPALLASTRGNSIEHQPLAHSLTSPSVTVSFTLPLEEAAGFLERVRSCLLSILASNRWCHRRWLRLRLRHGHQSQHGR